MPRHPWYLMSFAYRSTMLTVHSTGMPDRNHAYLCTVNNDAMPVRGLGAPCHNSTDVSTALSGKTKAKLTYAQNEITPVSNCKM